MTGLEDQIKNAVYRAIVPKIQEAIEEAVSEKLFREFDVSILKTPLESGNMSFSLVEPFDVSREVGQLTRSESVIDKVVGMYIKGLYRKDGKVFKLTQEERRILVQKIKRKLVL